MITIPSFKSIDSVLDQRQVVITLGTGGVGKTTVSAALAMRAAARGKKVLVLTIDPARRLVTSLGMKSLSDDATDLTDRLRAICPSCRGSLYALMPDTRKTFEAFVHALAPRPEIAESVLRNPIFQIFAREFSGANEYMALKRLETLHKSGEYDLIVLDTPPSRQTLGFLDGPRLLNRFFEEKLIHWIVQPGSRLVSTGMKKAFGILESLTGAGFITHLYEFAGALYEVRDNFTATLERVTSLLESPRSGFVLVTSPQPDALPEVRTILDSLDNRGLLFEGLILNRTLSYFGQLQDATIASEPSEPLRRALKIVQTIQSRENALTADLLEHSDAPICAKLPEMSRDIHSLEDLYHVALALDSRSLLGG